MTNRNEMAHGNNRTLQSGGSSSSRTLQGDSMIKRNQKRKSRLRTTGASIIALSCITCTTIPSILTSSITTVTGQTINYAGAPLGASSINSAFVDSGTHFTFNDPLKDAKNGKWAFAQGPQIDTYVTSSLTTKLLDGSEKFDVLGDVTDMVMRPETGEAYVTDARRGLINRIEDTLSMSSTNQKISRFIGPTMQVVTPGADTFNTVKLRAPENLVFDGENDHLYFTDMLSHRIYRVDVNDPARVEVMANFVGERGTSGNCGPATLSKFRFPRGLALAPARYDPITQVANSKLVVADTGNNLVREIEVTPWPKCLTKNVNIAPPTIKMYWDLFINGTGAYPYENGGLLSAFINFQTGKICAGEACYVKVIPGRKEFDIDRCAFACQFVGTNVYPFKELPEQLKEQDINLAERFGLGALTETQINIETLEFKTCVKVSAALKIAKGTKISCVYLDSDPTVCRTQQSLSSLKAVLKGLIRISFWIPIRCKRWYWVPNVENDDTPLVDLSGRCYLEWLAPTDPNEGCALTSTVMDYLVPAPMNYNIANDPPFAKPWPTCNATMSIYDLKDDGEIANLNSLPLCGSFANLVFAQAYSENSACRPGRMRNLFGNDNLGNDLEIDVDARGLVQWQEMHRLSSKLFSPYAVAINSQSQGLELWISDTNSHRIMRYATQAKSSFRIQFWALLSGPDRDKILASTSGALDSVFDAMFLPKGVDGSWIPMNLKQALTETGQATSNEYDMCDRYDVQKTEAQTQQTLEGKLKVLDLCDNICEDKSYHGKGVGIAGAVDPVTGNPFTWDGNYYGFGSNPVCCKAGCRKCLESCQERIYVMETAVSSMNRCEAKMDLDRCLRNNDNCVSASYYLRLEYENSDIDWKTLCPGLNPDKFNTGNHDFVGSLMRLGLDQTRNFRYERHCQAICPGWKKFHSAYELAWYGDGCGVIDCLDKSENECISSIPGSSSTKGTMPVHGYQDFQITKLLLPTNEKMFTRTDVITSLRIELDFVLQYEAWYWSWAWYAEFFIVDPTVNGFRAAAAHGLNDAELTDPDKYPGAMLVDSNAVLTHLRFINAGPENMIGNYTAVTPDENGVDYLSNIQAAIQADGMMPTKVRIADGLDTEAGVMVLPGGSLGDSISQSQVYAAVQALTPGVDCTVASPCSLNMYGPYFDPKDCPDGCDVVHVKAVFEVTPMAENQEFLLEYFNYPTKFEDSTYAASNLGPKLGEAGHNALAWANGTWGNRTYTIDPNQNTNYCGSNATTTALDDDDNATNSSSSCLSGWSPVAVIPTDYDLAKTAYDTEKLRWENERKRAFVVRFQDKILSSPVIPGTTRIVRLPFDPECWLPKLSDEDTTVLRTIDGCIGLRGPNFHSKRYYPPIAHPLTSPGNVLSQNTFPTAMTDTVGIFYVFAQDTEAYWVQQTKTLRDIRASTPTTKGSESERLKNTFDAQLRKRWTPALNGHLELVSAMGQGYDENRFFGNSFETQPKNGRHWTGSFMGPAMQRPGKAVSLATQHSRFRGPRGLTFDQSGQLYIADTENHRIKRMTTDGYSIDTVVAKSGRNYFAGDKGLALESMLSQPNTISIDPTTNDLFIMDTGNKRIRRVEGLQLPDVCDNTPTNIQKITQSATTEINENYRNFDRHRYLDIIDLAEKKIEGRCTAASNPYREKDWCEDKSPSTKSWAAEFAMAEVMCEGITPEGSRCNKSFCGALCENWSSTCVGALPNCTVSTSFASAIEGRLQKVTTSVETMLTQALTSLSARRTLTVECQQSMNIMRAGSQSTTSLINVVAQAGFGAFSAPQKRNFYSGIRNQLCPSSPGANNWNSALMCRDIFFEWYLDVSTLCDSDSYYYSKIDQVPRRIFEEENSNQCHPGCGLLHPRWGVGNDECCGTGGYKCGFGEGNCVRDSQCADGLICGSGNCLWSNQDNCCTNSNWFDSLHEVRELANKFGQEAAFVTADSKEWQWRVFTPTDTDEIKAHVNSIIR